MPARVLIGVLALAACAWFVMGIVQSRAQNELVGLINAHPKMTAAEIAHGRRLLGQARTLNPDRDLDLLEAELYQRAGDPAAATKVLLGTVRAQPRDVDAWHLLSFAAVTVDPALTVLASRKVRELVPPAPPAG